MKRRQSDKKYPKRVFPRIRFRKILDIDQLLKSYPDFLVVRMVSGSHAEYTCQVDGDSQFLPKVFGDRMPNLSMNIAGGLFDTDKERHLRFLPNPGPPTEPWLGGVVDRHICDNVDSYRIVSPCFGLCFYARKVHKKTFPFFMHFDSEKQRDDYVTRIESVSRIDEEKDMKLVGRFNEKEKKAEVHPFIRVNHAPTKANYWHAALDTWRPTDISPVQDVCSSTDRKMFSALKQDLLLKCEINAMPGYKIKRRDYIRDSRIWDVVLDLLGLSF